MCCFIYRLDERLEKMDLMVRFLIVCFFGTLLYFISNSNIVRWLIRLPAEFYLCNEFSELCLEIDDNFMAVTHLFRLIIHTLQSLPLHQVVPHQEHKKNYFLEDSWCKMLLSKRTFLVHKERVGPFMTPLGSV